MPRAFSTWNKVAQQQTIAAALCTLLNTQVKRRSFSTVFNAACAVHGLLITEVKSSKDVQTTEITPILWNFFEVKNETHEFYAPVVKTIVTELRENKVLYDVMYFPPNAFDKNCTAVLLLQHHSVSYRNSLDIYA